MKCIAILLLAVVATVMADGTVDITLPEHRVKEYRTYETPLLKTYDDKTHFIKTYKTDDTHFVKTYKTDDTHFVKTYKTDDTHFVKTYKTDETPFVRTYKTYETPIVKTYKTIEKTDDKKPLITQFAHEDFKTYPIETKVHTYPREYYYVPTYHTTYLRKH